MKLKLTPRQRQLLERLALGMSMVQAAYDIGISHGTAKVYMQDVRRSNRCSTFQLMYRFGQDEAAEKVAAFLNRRDAA